MSGVGTGFMSPPAFHVMLKPRGAVCNLDCKYCYYLSKKRLYPDSCFRISDDLLDRFTRQYIEAQRLPEVTFAWQGGEPTLMGLAFFERAIELQEQHKRPGMTIYNTLQTNGVTLDDDWCRFFKKHNFLIGVSIDGPKKLHDACRVNKKGRPTFDRVMAGLKLLKKHHIEFNTLTCVHPANVNYPLETYHFLCDEVKSCYVQFIPVVVRDNETGFQEGETVTKHSVTGKQYGNFLNGIFDEWVRRDVGQVFVQVFDIALAAWLGQNPGLCIFEEVCGTALALEHNGDLFSCDHFVEPHYYLGNINEDDLVTLVGSEQQREFGLAKRNTLPGYCQKCVVRFVCNGGCPKNRILRTPEGEPGLNYLCDGYKAFFGHIEPHMKFMATELLAGRSPANIMRAMPGTMPT